MMIFFSCSMHLDAPETLARPAIAFLFETDIYTTTSTSPYRNTRAEWSLHLRELSEENRIHEELTLVNYYSAIIHHPCIPSKPNQTASQCASYYSPKP